MAKEYFEKIFPKKLRIYDKMKKHHSYKKACSIKQAFYHRMVAHSGKAT